jgi:hypothetical protein
MQKTKKEKELSWQEKISRRHESNLRILNYIKKVINKYPDWRFFQIMTNLGYETEPDRFYEESYDTAQQVEEVVNDFVIGNTKKLNLREGVVIKVGGEEYKLDNVSEVPDGSYLVFCETFPNSRIATVVGDAIFFNEIEDGVVIDEVIDEITPNEIGLVKDIIEHGSVITELISTDDKSTLLMCNKEGRFAVVELDISDIHNIDFHYKEDTNYRLISPFGIHVLVENINDNLKTKYPSLKPGTPLDTTKGSVTVKDWFHMYNPTTLERETCIAINDGKSSYMARKQDILPPKKKHIRNRTKTPTYGDIIRFKTTG